MDYASAIKAGAATAIVCGIIYVIASAILYGMWQSSDDSKLLEAATILAVVSLVLGLFACVVVVCATWRVRYRIQPDS